MPALERAPSLIALAAAYETLTAAALQVRGVVEWMERYDDDARRLDPKEAVRLWVFTERAREVVNRVWTDTEELAQVLVRLFLEPDGSWPFEEAQRSEFHEVLAALAARDAEAQREKLDGRKLMAEPSDQAASS